MGNVTRGAWTNPVKAPTSIATTSRALEGLAKSGLIRARSSLTERAGPSSACETSPLGALPKTKT